MKQNVEKSLSNCSLQLTSSTDCNHLLSFFSGVCCKPQQHFVSAVWMVGSEHTCTCFMALSAAKGINSTRGFSVFLTQQKIVCFPIPASHTRAECRRPDSSLFSSASSDCLFARSVICPDRAELELGRMVAKTHLQRPLQDSKKCRVVQRKSQERQRQCRMMAAESWCYRALNNMLTEQRVRPRKW